MSLWQWPETEEELLEDFIIRASIRHDFHVLSDLILTAALQDRYYYLLCTKEDAEAKRN